MAKYRFTARPFCRYKKGGYRNMKTIGLISANYGSSEFGELLENRTLASLPY